MRLGAMMKAPAIHIFTHDSIYVGEDGPTHQPIEQLFSLRAVPNLFVYRPADAKETAAVFRQLLTVRYREGPSILALTRQNVPTLEHSYAEIEKGVFKGAYILFENKLSPKILIAATGSEVHLALEVAKKL